MKRRTLRTLFTGLTFATGFSSASLFATGDFYEEPLQTLADYLRLDQLPAKSFEQIHDETSKPEDKPNNFNYQKELIELGKKPGAEALVKLDQMIAAAPRQKASYCSSDPPELSVGGLGVDPAREAHSSRMNGC